MLRLYQTAIRSLFSEDTSKNVREGPLSMIMGSQYNSNGTRVIKLVTHIKEKEYMEMTDESKIGYTSAYLDNINSLPIVQLIGMNVKPKSEHWQKISLNAFNNRVPMIPIDFPNKEGINPEEYAHFLLLVLVPNIECYVGTLNLGSELNSFIKSTAVQPASKYFDDDMEAYRYLAENGIGLYHTPGCTIKRLSYHKYECFDQLRIDIHKKDIKDTYKIGEWDDNMLVYKGDESQRVDNQDITEQIINGDKYTPSLIIVKINISYENGVAIDDLSSKEIRYYLIPAHILRMFK